MPWPGGWQFDHHGAEQAQQAVAPGAAPGPERLLTRTQRQTKELADQAAQACLLSLCRFVPVPASVSLCVNLSGALYLCLWLSLCLSLLSASLSPCLSLSRSLAYRATQVEPERWLPEGDGLGRTYYRSSRTGEAVWQPPAGADTGALTATLGGAGQFAGVGAAIAAALAAKQAAEAGGLGGLLGAYGGGSDSDSD